MTTTTATTAPTRFWSSARDDYGRRTHALIEGGALLAIVVRMPKVFIEQYGTERTYLVNLTPSAGADRKTAEAPTLAKAKALAVAFHSAS